MVCTGTLKYIIHQGGKNNQKIPQSITRFSKKKTEYTVSII